MTDEPTSGVEAVRALEALMEDMRAHVDANDETAMILPRAQFNRYVGRIARVRAALATPSASPSPAPAAVEELVARLVDLALSALGGERAAYESSREQLEADIEEAAEKINSALREAATALSTLAADKAKAEAERDTAKGTAELATDVLKKEWASHRDTLDRAIAAEARASALEGALKQIASQKTVNELCAEFGKDYETDWEGGYDQCIATARAAIRKETP